MPAEHNRPGEGAPRDAVAIAETAAHWLARRDRGLSAGEVNAFNAWRHADARHAAEFDRLVAAWERCEHAKEVPELAAMAAGLDRATAARSRSPTRRHALWLGSLAAAAAVVLVGGVASSGLFVDSRAPRIEVTRGYEVQPSAAKRLVLDDGSVALSRADSEIRAEFSATERRVVLVRGEAHFTVQKDPSRPFVVSAGPASVRAVGTAFNVRLDPQRVEVLVTHGTVEVADTRAPAAAAALPPLVEAGQRAVIETEPAATDSRNIAVAPAASAEIEQALAWQSTRLIFSRTSLAQAVAAFNQHATPTGARLVIGDPTLQARQLGGTFRASNVDGFVRLLEQGGDVRVERRGNDFVLLPRH